VAIYADDGDAYDVHSRFGGAARCREMFCIREVPRIRLLGLRDTVSSFGWAEKDQRADWRSGAGPWPGALAVSVERAVELTPAIDQRVMRIR
jgi:hypothetical protein